LIENLIDTQHGLPTLLAGIIILLSLHLFAKIGEFIFGLLKKEKKTDHLQINEISLALSRNTEAIRELKGELRIQIGQFEREMAGLRKDKADRAHLLSGIKILAGPRWAKVRKAMEDNTLPE
jgi:hypothetical protein